MKPWTTQATVDLVKMMRQIADHIEHLGPNCLKPESLLTIRTEFTAANTPHGLLAQTDNRPVQHKVDMNVTLRNEVPGGSPKNGLKPARVMGSSTIVRWDGQPARPPRKGEYYNMVDEPECNSPDIIKALRARKKAFYIYEECS